MKIILLLGLAAVAWANGVTEHIPHFRVTDLSADFQNYEGLPDTCNDMSKDCVKGGHGHARRCIGMFYAEKRAEISECKNENEDLRQASKEWQEASFAWHKAVDDCLAGNDAPEEEADRVFFFFRRKRQADIDCSVADDHTRDDYESGKACWQDFMLHKKKCAHCVKEDDGCSDYVACTGRGASPSDARLAGWHAYARKLGKDKKNKIKRAKRMLFECLGLGDDDDDDDD